MATVRITGNPPGNLHKKEWLGAPEISAEGKIERSLELPAEVYESLERQIATGNLEGFIFLPDGRRLEWFLDRTGPTGGGTAVVMGH